MPSDPDICTLAPDVLSDLDFGEDSAEAERSFLERVFVRTAIFERILKGQKQLILGRKGSGKTALCLMIHRELTQEGHDVILMAPHDLILGPKPETDSNRTARQWRTALLGQIAKQITMLTQKTVGANRLKWPNDARLLRSFLIHNFEAERRWLDKVMSFIRSFRKIKALGAEIEFEAQKRDDASMNVTLNAATESIRLSLSRDAKKTFYILVDKADESWGSRPEDEAMITGLLKAAKEVSEQLSQVRVIVFLRSDIYDSLQFHDSDKFHSMEERIVWGRKDLLKMVAIRASESTKGLCGTADSVMTRLFPKFVEGKATFEFLLSHTLLRPRDIIQLCNICRDRAQDDRSGNIDEIHVIEALPLYSKWKLKDLRDEYIVQYPFLEQVFLGVFQHATYWMTHDDIVDRLGIIKESLSREFGPALFDPPETLLQILYNIGFLGAVKNGRTLYAYKGESIFIPYVVLFEIHPSFRLALEIQPGAVTVGRDVILQGGTAVAAGKGGVSIGGDIHGGIRIGGESARRKWEED
ncbi:MAG TPA: ATP-binding protein [Thermoanaerobaculia bacterium]|jgi:hypothetical protein|nr:ATP-binding protein [Thermoanaerobaculia bacterium]